MSFSHCHYFVAMQAVSVEEREEEDREEMVNPKFVYLSTNHYVR